MYKGNRSVSKTTSIVEIWQDIGFSDNTNISLSFVGNLVFKILRQEYMRLVS
jgi:hypothetical protein